MGAAQPPNLPPASAGPIPDRPKANPVNAGIVGKVVALVLAIFILGGLASAFQTDRPRKAFRADSSREIEQPGRPARPTWSSRKTKTVQLKIGTATITDDRTGTSHVRVACNNGLVIDADWKRNPGNDFGYDIYEPSVNRDYNRLAVMMTARGIIAAYLRGEYD